jgi:hypothetical protein
MHPKYLTLIAFPRQKCLGEGDSVLRYTHIACIFTLCNDEDEKGIVNSEDLSFLKIWP